MAFHNVLIVWCAACIVLAVVLLGSAANSAETKTEPQPQEALAPAEQPTLYAVGYAHLDTQWRWAYPLAIRDYLANTLHDNFALFEKYPSYIFNFSGANRYRMIKEYYPEDYKKLKAYIADGRWFPCGSSMEECDVNVPSAESIIRQVLYGNNYFRQEFGTASDEFMLPDCFGFPASLPSLLAHCGLKGFSTQKLTWGSAVGIPFNVGVWEGLDGKFVVAAFNPGSYGSQIKSDLSQNADWLQRIKANGEATGIFKDYLYYGTGDIGGAPTQQSVYWMEQSVAGGGPLKVLSTPADQLFKELTAEQVAGLPRYQGDLELTQHSAGSITSQAYMKRWNRQNELLADCAERASVMANLLGGVDYPQAKLNNAWTLVMGGQFHDILPGTSLPEAYGFSHNDEVLALNQFADVLETAVASIASGLDTQGDGTALVVYNPLALAREDLVEAVLPVPAERTGLAVVVSGPDGGAVPAQVSKLADGTAKVQFVARVPSVGFAVYNVRFADAAGSSDDQLKATETQLENHRYRVSLDGNGDVSSIYDKLAAREMLSAPARLAFTTDAPGYWPAWNMDWADAQKPPRSYVSGPAQVRIVESGPARVALEVVRESEGSRFVQTISLAAGAAGERVEFHNVIDWRSTACNLKASFPLRVSNPQATYNWEVGTIMRGNNDEKKYEVPSHQWFDLTDVKGNYGVTVLAPYKYGSDKPDDNTLRLTLLRTPGIHSDDYGDQASQDWGRHEISYGLAGHAGDWRSGQTDWQALRLEQPLIAFQCGPHPGALGKSYSVLTVDNPRVRVLALKKAEGSDETVVRLVELNGADAPRVKLGFGAAVLSAREIDGQERPIGEALVEDGKLVADFTPYNLRCFAVRLGAPDATVTAVTSAAVALPCNASVTSRDNEVALGGFDTDGRCLDAGMLPRRLVDAGISFDLAAGGESANDAVSCSGQTIALPSGDFNRLYLLAAAAPQEQTVEFKIDGQPSTRSIQDWGGFVGLWDTRVWSSGSPEVAFDWPYTVTELNPGFTKRAPVAWYCSHRHDASGNNLIYSYSYLYRITLDLPAGARELTLPDNDKVMVLAVSVAKDAANACKPAQPLYDTLETHAALKLALAE